MKEVIELQKVKEQVKALKEREKELSAQIMGWLHEQGARKAETPFGTVSIRTRKKYFYTEETEMIAEEYKTAKKKDEERALTRKEWESLGKPSDIPVFDENEHLAVNIKKVKE